MCCRQKYKECDSISFHIKRTAFFGMRKLGNYPLPDKVVSSVAFILSYVVRSCRFRLFIYIQFYVDSSASYVERRDSGIFFLIRRRLHIRFYNAVSLMRSEFFILSQSVLSYWNRSRWFDSAKASHRFVRAARRRRSSREKKDGWVASPPMTHFSAHENLLGALV